MQKSKVLVDKSRLNGFKVRILDTQESVHAGLEIPAHLENDILKGKMNADFNKVLLEIASEFSLDILPEGEQNLDDIIFNAEWGIGKNAEYDGFEARDIIDPESGEKYTGFLTTEIMLDKITFAGYTKAYLKEQLDQTALFFSSYPSFYGFAIHYYLTYKEMPDN